ncbi:MAG: hypothetical protein M1833_004511 [Piccolia ochrophora]|nr:MAG: hypothetical protein M1833_004511 [Piccolia ochrophora]
MSSSQSLQDCSRFDNRKEANQNQRFEIDFVSLPANALFNAQKNGKDHRSSHSKRKRGNITRSDGIPDEPVKMSDLRTTTPVGLQAHLGSMSPPSHSTRPPRTAVDTLVDVTAAVQLERDALDMELRQARDEIRELQAINSELKDTIFAQQPQVRITDDVLANKYIAIHHSINDWVERSFETVLDAGAFFGGLECQSERGGPYLSFFDQHVGLPTLRAASQFPTSDGSVISSAVIHCLWKWIFEPYFFSSPLQAKVFQSIHSMMASDSLRRDANTINTWRSDTLTAFSALPESRSQWETGLSDVVCNIANPLMSLLASTSSLNFASTALLEDIVKPAGDLAKELQTSPVSYGLQWSGMNRSYERLQHFPPDLTQYTLIDVHSRQTIKHQKAFNGKTVKYLLDVFPGLVKTRFRGNEGSQVTLVKPTVLFAFSDTPPSMPAPQGTTTSWDCQIA